METELPTELRLVALRLPLCQRNVRNWGATYWIDTPDLRIAVLADAGVDPAGDIADAVAVVAKRRGPPDIVTACHRTFPSPFYGVLSLDWLTLDVDRLRDLCRLHHEGRLPPVTLGPAGLAPVALACGAKWSRRMRTEYPDVRGISVRRRVCAGRRLRMPRWPRGRCVDPTKPVAGLQWAICLELLECGFEVVDLLAVGLVHAEAEGARREDTFGARIHERKSSEAHPLVRYAPLELAID